MQPSDRSEMASQLLFGEMAEVIEKQGNWLNVKCLWDACTGWLDASQVEKITPSEVDFFQTSHGTSLALVEGVMAENHFLPVLLGSTLPGFDGIRLRIGDRSLTFSGQTIFSSEIRPTGELISRIARKYLHAPYLAGGRSPFGIDAAGLTQMVFKMAGMPLHREAAMQVNHGRIVHFMEETQPGDLAFFDDEKGRINHVGLLISENQVIHANGRVRLDRCDHFGIFNEEQNRYTHQMRVVKRLLPDEIVEKTKPVARAEQEIGLPQAALFE